MGVLPQRHAVRGRGGAADEDGQPGDGVPGADVDDLREGLGDNSVVNALDCAAKEEFGGSLVEQGADGALSFGCLSQMAECFSELGRAPRCNLDGRCPIAVLSEFGRLLLREDGVGEWRIIRISLFR